MTDTLSLLERDEPEAWIEKAKAEHKPIRTFCLFSGGSDSLVVAHRCRDHYDELVHIDTGTAVPGVQDHVRQCAKDLDKPLRILTQDFDAFRLLVLGGVDWKGREWNVDGFPGPAQHGRAYNRLKQRPLEHLLRETKVGHPRNARVLALAGIRQAESKRRAKRAPINRKGSLVFVNPLIEWSNAEMQDYRDEHGLKLSDVAAILHRSGECNCGCFADENEREMLKSLWPDWFEERIASVEREADKKGLKCPRWGGNRGELPADAGPLCSSCEVRIEGQLDLLEAEADAGAAT
jgi:3'-phosphoadenosine 5'-phosphosulfate sulfotransferase (PAPS reductase)/FAD synthetase